MKKLIIGLLVGVGIFGVLSLVSPKAYAFDLLGGTCTSAGSQSAACTGQSINNPAAVAIARVTQIILLVTGVACVITVIISGIRYSLSSGDPNNVNNAKNAIIYALVGLAIAATGQFAVIFVLSKL